MKTVNLGFVAHVDAGKTTLTELILYKCGNIRSLGSVDSGTAHTDFTDFERKRGISVRAASTAVTYNDVSVNIIDTPGHNDFSAETDRVLRVLDCAVLVISAVEGIQSRTEILWDLLAELGIPVFLFINKTDRSGADIKNVINQIKKRFTGNIICLCDEHREKVIENDDNLLNKYIDGQPIGDEEINESLKNQIMDRQAFPLMWGSAMKDDGIDALLDAICTYMPSADVIDDEPSGIIFKTEHDSVMGRISHVRLYSGTLKSRDSVFNMTSGCEEKITQIRKFYGKKSQDVGVIKSGDIASLCGLSNSKAGDIIGCGRHLPKECKISEPTLRVRVFPENESDYPKAVAALNELKAENPELGVIWEKEKRELLINITGNIYLEVLSELFKTRFSMNVTFGQPSVIYKETPSSENIGYVRYTMPKPCWAVLKFKIEPLEKDSGVVYDSIVPNDKIYYRYQSQVKKTIMSALQQGPKGWEVTDLRITLIDGEHHIEHTHPLDFIVATPMGIMDGLVNTGTTLLEPMLRFKISAPEYFSGRIMGDIINMRGTFENPTVKDGTFFIEGRYPVATSMNYPVKLASETSGKATLAVRPDGYEKCDIENGKTTPYRGVSPLDRAKYILYIRSALSD